MRTKSDIIIILNIKVFLQIKSR